MFCFFVSRYCIFVWKKPLSETLDMPTFKQQLIDDFGARCKLSLISIKTCAYLFQVICMNISNTQPYSAVLDPYTSQRMVIPDSRIVIPRKINSSPLKNDDIWKTMFLLNWSRFRVDSGGLILLHSLSITRIGPSHRPKSKTPASPNDDLETKVVESNLRFSRFLSM